MHKWHTTILHLWQHNKAVLSVHDFTSILLIPVCCCSKSFYILSWYFAANVLFKLYFTKMVNLAFLWCLKSPFLYWHCKVRLFELKQVSSVTKGTLKNFKTWDPGGQAVGNWSCCYARPGIRFPSLALNQSKPTNASCQPFYFLTSLHFK